MVKGIDFDILLKPLYVNDVDEIYILEVCEFGGILT